MRHWKIWLYLVAVIAIFMSCFLAGNPRALDALRAPVEIAAAAPTQAPEAPAQPAAQAVITATTSATEAPTEAPVETAVAAAAQVDYCVECHTDKAQLIDTAAPEEEKVEESEGAG